MKIRRLGAGAWMCGLAFLGIGGEAWGGSRLAWGSLLSWQAETTEPASAALAPVLMNAQTALATTFETTAALHLEGTLNRDPAHQESDRVKASFPAIFDLAVCARLAPDPLRTQCLEKARTALLGWADIYRPSGNPIDERFFVPVLQAVDLIASVVPPADNKVLLAWTHAFADAGDAFFDRRPATDTARSNNWMAARLLVRALATTICADRPLQRGTRKLLDSFVNRNFVANQYGEMDGTTFDFLQRDALAYQVTDLLFLTKIALLTPAIVSPHARALILSGLQFLEPYFSGARQHIEFVNTRVLFDRQRRDEDVNNPAFQNKPWNPMQAYPLLRLARLAFPELHPWTEAVVAGHYGNRIKLLAAAFGDPGP